ncbi:hypothetical protein CPB85DRAFT_1323295, partial [Mucidula mucida]
MERDDIQEVRFVHLHANVAFFVVSSFGHLRSAAIPGVPGGSSKFPGKKVNMIIVCGGGLSARFFWRGTYFARVRLRRRNNDGNRQVRSGRLGHYWNCS